MRILVVSHRYPPAYTAGTEVYSAQLAAGMAARGHAVQVLCTEKDLARADLSLSRRSHEGLAVTELVNNLFHEDLQDTWRRPQIDALFGQLLDRERPDLVHLMHLMYLSTGCVAEARRRGIPVVFTLHDFWLACPRFGQLRHPDGSLCETIDFARCGGCMVSFKHAQSSLERATGKAIARLHAATGVDLSGAARSAARGLSRPAPSEPWSEPDPAAARALAVKIEARRDHMQGVLAPGVARFIAPSRFLGERMLAWGLPRERVAVITTGIDPARYAPRSEPAGRNSPLRVLFLGTYAEHKGAHVLLAAWAALPAELRARGRLDLHGPPSPDLGYIERVERAAAACGAHVHGPMPRAEIAPAMAAADLVVVPSIWYENAPMVILEALAVRTPLAVSGLGGMAELVRPGVSGFHFKTGDAQDLGARLAAVLRDPSSLARLYPAGAHERTFDDTLDDVEAIYAAVRSEARP